ncbi:3-oxoadipate enol-lactonase [Acinetobacter baylyi]|uniref:3-oxoadipate enol-lactonase n=1 Tax=Acinetobacter baylyi TaxID=202950 RepID=A0ABU0USQ8_ACIBI|nr:3-oxoadipate enol-lactonase [Acinetobacter baylyi]MDQ1207588.1 3-oxoadipate enol-lactonase [Acinetobacter baylyi]MDR6105336.1 3-oxoadipate enol-lactonase [Acinetobacter baylyi]MDR6184457.1 3-oxoadipate enol-lactonase [Acinetobacter baylyi]
MSEIHSIMITNRQGKTLSVQINGPENAPAIVFSNSLGTDHGMWQPQVAALKSQYRVVTYDTRGHGQSDVIENTTLQNLGEDVLDILDALNIEKAHFCGISMGGMTALWLGIYQAARFYSITVANSAAKIWTEDGWNARAEAVEANGLADLVASTHTRWFSDKFDYKNDNLAQKTIQSLADTPAQGYANACRALAKADVREKLASISIPTLIIAGSADPVTTITDGEFMQQHIQCSQFEVIDASHLSNIEQPEKFIQIFSGFVKSIQ